MPRYADMSTDESASKDPEADRTRHILKLQLTAAIMGLNAAYCSKDGEEELCNRPGFIKGLVKDLAESCSPMALEDAIGVLQHAYNAKGPMGPVGG